MVIKDIMAFKCDVEDDLPVFGVYLWGYQLDVRFGSLLRCLQIIFL